ncbi:hypothetical protein [Motiliproteus sp. MSK22-1]|uniref:hypothetical protein n=1 Tax=Motiliproteus sp. MSK22-1 TaxID=1897630 RepID=UPI000976725A|nr:hypothetical protein [Motiliproteus sp. MSK22-1]OMH36575.1 hypothetical protein BGP75_09495 [Motiliproteus sp. MSK22-1]
MNTEIHKISCQALGTFSDELVRLSEMGYTHATHASIAQLQPKEFVIHFPPAINAKSDDISLYYRDG